MGEALPRPTETAHSLPIDLLDVNPFQPRRAMDGEALAELTSSVRNSGVLQPLLVRPHPGSAGRFQLIAGERRWRAAQAAGLHDVPVLVRDMTDRDVVAAALVENLQREDLNPIEEAAGYRRLMAEFAMTQEELAGALGKSRSHVANTLRLLKLPESVQEQLASGLLTAGHARALLSHSDPEAGAKLVIATGLNVRQTEALLDNATDMPPKSRPDAETEALARDLSERLGLRVEISSNGRAGAIRLRYSSLDQLDGIIALLSR